MTLLTLDNLSVTFDSRPVVKNVSFTLDKGEVLALVGESGSGKSLTAQSILKLLPPNATTTGEILFDGDSLSTQTTAGIARYRGARIGMIFQEPMSALNPLHPIQRQIIEPYCLHKHVRPKSTEASARLNSLLEAVGLSHLIARGKLYPHQLSGGERQRAMIAMAIACDPDLLIADEPTTALDVTLQRQILDLLLALQTERQMAMLFITHDLPVVRHIAHRVAVMRHGEIVEQGAVSQAFAAPQHDYTRLLLTAIPKSNPAPLPANSPALLHTENLSVRFPIKGGLLRHTVGETKAVNHVSLTLRTGETLGIVGESGSGKSTLAYAILRLIKSEGPIVFLGKRFDQLPPQELRAMRRHAQLVFQDPYGSLNPRMTVAQIIAEGLKLHHIPGGGLTPPSLTLTPAASGASLRSTQTGTSASIDQAVDQILEQVGLDPAMKSRYPHAFSGGQRQRIAIARAMVLKPQLVVLDEPTSALDMSVQKQVLELLASLQQTHGVSYLFITHDLRVVRAMAHQLLVLKHGDVVEQGSAESIFAAPQHDYTKRLFAAAFPE